MLENISEPIIDNVSEKEILSANIVKPITNNANENL